MFVQIIHTNVSNNDRKRLYVTVNKSTLRQAKYIVNKILLFAILAQTPPRNVTLPTPDLYVTSNQVLNARGSSSCEKFRFVTAAAITLTM